MARIVGAVDGLDGCRVSGWAYDADAPERILTIVFFRDGPDAETIELARVRANRPRRDDASGDHSGHGFEWRMPFQSHEFALGLRLAEEAFEFPDSPLRVVPAVFYEGHFDGIERGVARGWARAWDPSIAVAVEVHVDRSHRATVPASTERPDLILAHVGDGRHAFAWVAPDQLADGAPHEFACRIAGTDFWLGGCPKTAVISRGDRSLGLAGAVEARGYAPRPCLPSPQLPPWYARLLPSLRGGRWHQRASNPNVTTGELLRHPLPSVVGSKTIGRQSGSRLVRLLVPVWGADYIDGFCRTGLASLLSPNNLPALAERYPLEVVFLTRQADTVLIEAYPTFRKLASFATTTFLAIDDILARYFDPGPHAYAMALSYAFLHGIRAMGERAYDTDFLFWNADFVAADGTFRTVAELIAAGVRCTYAPSLRVDRAIEAAELDPRRSADSTVLDISPREWVRLAGRFQHPTVRAQTLNRHEERMIDTVNQLYWQVDDGLLVGRVFLMFMLHIRPERVPEELYGHCDYVFVPEMVPSGEIHVETLSDRVLIIEPQHHNREWQDIVSGDTPPTPAEIARGVDRWTTREHRLTSRHMVVFNGHGDAPDLAAARAMTDAFMDRVYELLSPEPVWHNGHFFWVDSLAALGQPYEAPGPGRPRSHLAAALRWTSYDIDILRESWPGPAGPPDLFNLELPLAADFDPGAWLADMHARYLRAWRAADPLELGDPRQLDLVSGHFHGFGWGLVERCDDEAWARLLGPDGRATLLLRLPRRRRARLLLYGADDGLDTLDVAVNDHPAAALYDGVRDARPAVRLDLPAREDGRLEILLRAPPGGRLALTGLEISLR